MHVTQKAGVKSLYERRLQYKACMMFKVRHDLCPPTVKTLFSLKSSTYNLRGADFHIPRFNTVAYGKHSPDISDLCCEFDFKLTLKTYHLCNLLKNRSV